MANVDITRIAGNIGAANALNALTNINKQLALHQTRLQTGKAINSAADDPAGYTIATKMLARSEGLKVALNNISDASNMMSVAEGGLSKMNDILVQMRDKAEEAASDTLGTTERQAIQTQLSAYAEQIDNIVNETKWNGVKLLDGTVSKQFQTGADDGEVTTWNLSQNHGATGAGSLEIAKNVAANLATAGANVKAGAGVTAINETQAANKNFSVLATGNYQVNILNVGTNAAGNAGDSQILSQGAIDTATGSMSLIASDPDEGFSMANGENTITIQSYTAGNGTDDGSITYSLDGGATSLTAHAATAADGAAIDLVDSGGKKIGVTVQASAGTTITAASQDITVDYLQSGFAKAQLKTADGTNVSVAAGDGSAATYFYLDGNTAGTAVDTGRGLKVSSGTWANMLTAAKNDTAFNFTYEKANAYSVNVSTAKLASAYMQTVTNAMDTVNNSMASLGSLMARLDFKSDQVSSAQINVEASYNRIMNANMAEEQMDASKYSILQQTATAMLAQANQAPQSLLPLFR
ncbi:MAG TPA: flagellin [Longilinea sp.]|nr:flagellin [Longilinea sp.]